MERGQGLWSLGLRAGQLVGSKRELLSISPPLIKIPSKPPCSSTLPWCFRTFRCYRGRNPCHWIFELDLSWDV